MVDSSSRYDSVKACQEAYDVFHRQEVEKSNELIDIPGELGQDGYNKERIKAAFMFNSLIRIPSGPNEFIIRGTLMKYVQDWYPDGVIIFLGPDVGCLNEQIKYFESSFNLPNAKLGTISDELDFSQRQNVWKTCNIIFDTYKGFKKHFIPKDFPVERIKLLVAAEAHHVATHKDAMEKIITKMLEGNRNFRLVAFSCAPAATVKSMTHIIHNLKLYAMVINDKAKADFEFYWKPCKITLICIPTQCPKLERYISQCYHLIGNLIDRLQETGFTKVTKLEMNRYEIQKLYYKLGMQKIRSGSNYTDVHRLSVLWGGYICLQANGIRSFYEYMMEKDQDLLNWSGCKTLMEEIEFNYFPLPTIDSVMYGNCHDTLATITFNDGKLSMLVEELTKHLQAESPMNVTAKRVIVYATYAISVQEIYFYLKKLDNELIKPQIFMGNALEKAYNGLLQFKNGEANVLVATGQLRNSNVLGEVDIIIYYDCIQIHAQNHLLETRYTAQTKPGEVIFLAHPEEETKNVNELLAQRNSLPTDVWEHPEPRMWVDMRMPLVIPRNIEFTLNDSYRGLPPEVSSAHKKSTPGESSKFVRDTDSTFASSETSIRYVFQST